VYLGSLLTSDGDRNKEFKRRIARAAKVMVEFRSIWNSKNISIQTKLSIIRTCVMSVVLYALATQKTGAERTVSIRDEML